MKSKLHADTATKIRRTKVRRYVRQVFTDYKHLNDVHEDFEGRLQGVPEMSDFVTTSKRGLHHVFQLGRHHLRGKYSFSWGGEQSGEFYLVLGKHLWLSKVARVILPDYPTSPAGGSAPPPCFTSGGYTKKRLRRVLPLSTFGIRVTTCIFQQRQPVSQHHLPASEPTPSCE
jgi:hypothetical protein